MKLRHIIFAVAVAVAAAWVGAERVGGPRTFWAGAADPRVVLREWVLEMHRAQFELLKIDWGNPGFCTEWDRGFDRRTGRCADGRRAMQR